LRHSREGKRGPKAFAEDSGQEARHAPDKVSVFSSAVDHDHKVQVIFCNGKVINADALLFCLAKDHVEHGLSFRKDLFLGL
jgi:hypothetical protein